MSNQRIEQEPVGFVGLGTMGRPMARSLLQAGFPVVVWNRGPEPSAQRAAAGARLAPTPADLARAAPLVLTMLPDLAEVGEVLDRPDGLLAGLRRGSVLVVMGTVSPSGVRELGGRLEPSGIAAVDAPVSGGDV